MNKEVMQQALAYVRWTAFGECRTPGWDGSPPTAAETVAALEDAIAWTNSILSNLRELKVQQDAEKGVFSVFNACMYKEQCRAAIAQPTVSDTSHEIEQYMAANYPDAKGATLAERVIDALEKMDIELGMKEIKAQPVRPAVSDASDKNQVISQCVDIFYNYPGKNISETLYRIAFAAYREGQKAPSKRAPTQVASVPAIPEDIVKAAISIKHNGYRGSLSQARRVFDWVAASAPTEGSQA